ncbi:ketopantoate reductase family protein [Maliponia aquimaris]|uniref:2-dehydropantoate 2-reductase n=1 Tax=Maliponia aquimaris TaxID=1673631 RepID=A0A238L8P0_9RHOB|nr:ketopantoate reductase family protein [Maliponia aquimaris]SMX50742.1 2-dehydropantoate 2-reductase [Maliponia aquimaris]
MRIATMATGGIGGYLAVKLTEAGHEVATIARGAHLEAIRQNGLTLHSPDGRVTVQPWQATDTPAEVGPVEAVIFGVKGDALPQAARACLPMLGPDTVVVPFLNGVEAAERLLEILPEGNVANGMASVSTTIAEPGVIRQTGTFANFTFAERDNRPSARIAALRAALAGAGVDAPVPKDIDRAVWTKFVLFSAMSGVTAAGRCTIGDILAHPPLGALFRQVLTETAAIGRTLGVALPTDAEEKAWQIAKTLPPAMRASTAVDVEHGRPLEIEWVSGAAVRLAERAGVLAPANKALYALLLPHKDGRRD